MSKLRKGRIIKRFSFALIISSLISILYYSCDYSDTDEVETADSGAETQNQAAVSHIERGDGNELILSGTDSFDTAVFDFADELGADFAENGFSVVFGDAVLYFGKPISGEGGAAARKLDSIEAYGQTVKLGMSFLGDHAVNIRYFDSGILVTDYSYGVGDTYIITADGVWEQHTEANLGADNCNEPVISFSVADGRLEFTCRPRKYINYGTAGDLLMYSAGRDEIYSVEGQAEFDGRSPSYTSAEVSLLSDIYTDDQLQAEFELLYDFIDGKYVPVSDYETLDSLFEKNKTKYGEFIWGD